MKSPIRGHRVTMAKAEFNSVNEYIASKPRDLRVSETHRERTSNRLTSAQVGGSASSWIKSVMKHSRYTCAKPGNLPHAKTNEPPASSARQKHTAAPVAAVYDHR